MLRNPVSVLLVGLCLLLALRPGSAAAQGEGGVETSGNYVAALDFNVTTDGFSFPNYINEGGVQNLTPNEVVRLFGEGVCGAIQDGACILTYSAEQWMNQVNEFMNGGHCEGMAVLSMAFEDKLRTPADFGAETTGQLQFQGNELLQREIAYWWSIQVIPEVLTLKVYHGLTPRDVVATLIEGFQASPPVTYTLTVRKPDLTGAHEITPWAVEDRGNGLVWILVYDNNHPGVNRAVEVDLNANTWQYSLSTNPDIPEALYQGDAETKTLGVTPVSLRLEKFPCPVCVDSPQQTTGLLPASFAETDVDYNEIWLEGEGDLLIVDEQGRRVGYADGKLVNEIPGAYIAALAAGSVEPWKNTNEPIYFIPTDIAFQITIDGSRLQAETLTDVVLLGPGYYLGITEVSLAPGQQDRVTFAKDGTVLSYETQSAESPILILGFEGKGQDAADYAFALAGVDLEGGVITIGFDFDKGWLGVSTEGSQKEATYGLVLERLDTSGEATFGTNDDGVTLQPGDTIYIEYAKWAGDNSPLSLLIDRGGDDTIDEELQLQDVK